MFNSDNEYPSFNVGDEIDGVAIAENVGGEAADLTGYCMVYWSNGPLPMFHPGWTFQPDKQTWFAYEKNQAGYPRKVSPNEHRVEAGEPARCDEIHARIDAANKGRDFYVIGHIAFFDGLRRKHDVKFARKYVLSEKRFKASEDQNYEFNDND